MTATRSATADAVSGNLREGNHAQKAGIGKEAEAEGNEEGNELVEALASGELGYRSDELGQLIQLAPGSTIGAGPAMRHNNYKAG